MPKLLQGGTVAHRFSANGGVTNNTERMRRGQRGKREPQATLPGGLGPVHLSFAVPNLAT
jgi:hypothetical protein